VKTGRFTVLYAAGDFVPMAASSGTWTLTMPGRCDAAAAAEYCKTANIIGADRCEFVRLQGTSSVTILDLKSANSTEFMRGKLVKLLGGIIVFLVVLLPLLWFGLGGSCVFAWENVTNLPCGGFPWADVSWSHLGPDMTNPPPFPGLVPLRFATRQANFEYYYISPVDLLKDLSAWLFLYCILGVIGLTTYLKRRVKRRTSPRNSCKPDFG
jgi:hypothetical protein